MLRELKPQAYPLEFGGAKLFLRYDTESFYRLEIAGYSYEDIFADTASGALIAAFFHAGLTENIGAEREKGVIDSLGISKIWGHCRAAMLLALPEPDPLIIPDVRAKRTEGGADFERLRCLVCDVMRKDEDFFWRSTLRELLSRWQSFAVAKGYCEPPERMVMFDTEGME